MRPCISLFLTCTSTLPPHLHLSLFLLVLFSYSQPSSQWATLSNPPYPPGPRLTDKAKPPHHHHLTLSLPPPKGGSYQITVGSGLRLRTIPPAVSGPAPSPTPTTGQECVYFPAPLPLSTISASFYTSKSPHPLLLLPLSTSTPRCLPSSLSLAL